MWQSTYAFPTSNLSKRKIIKTSRSSEMESLVTGAKYKETYCGFVRKTNLRDVLLLQYKSNSWNLASSSLWKELQWY